jgi:hypothetical protein
MDRARSGERAGKLGNGIGRAGVATMGEHERARADHYLVGVVAALAHALQYGAAQPAGGVIIGLDEDDDGADQTGSWPWR